MNLASSGVDGTSGLPISGSFAIDDRVECEFCNRKFNKETAERHRPICEK